MSYWDNGCFCKSCRYDLRELDTPVCPECGREFDPADPSTFLTRPSLNPPIYQRAMEAFAIAYPLGLKFISILAYILNAMHFGQWRFPYKYIADSALVKTLCDITTILFLLLLFVFPCSLGIWVYSAWRRLEHDPIEWRSAGVLLAIPAAWILLSLSLFSNMFIDLLWFWN